MARKTIDITITDEGRDQGKTFRITEMPAVRAEKWAIRALTLVARSGVDIGNIAGLGMAGIAMLGVQAIMSVSFDEIEPLLDEMMECITSVPDRSRPMINPPLMENDIEEIATRFRLRQEVISLHVGFSMNGAQSNEITSPAPASMSNSSNTPTFPEPSVQFSRLPKTKQRRSGT
jgi:hypothetical protein